MRPKSEYKVVAAISHVVTIIPGFIIGWQLGVGMMLFWGFIDLIPYLILKN